MRLRLLSLLASLLACSDGGKPLGGALDPGPGLVGGGGQGGGGQGGQGGGGQGGVDCDVVGASIFTVTEDARLLRFSPRSSVFSEIGKISCPGVTAGPYSMSVDRAADAWVLFLDGQIFKVSTLDASCRQSGYEPAQNGWIVFGMGFTSHPPGSESERLYVADATRTTLQQIGVEQGLGRLSGGRLDVVGPFDGDLAGQVAELTGRGDGRLFGFFPQQPALAEIDPSTARITARTQLPISASTAWAFAHWGGAFYLFAASGQSTSRVYRYRYGVPLEEVVQDAGVRIVGAGVSTCAPLTETTN